MHKKKRQIAFALFNFVLFCAVLLLHTTVSAHLKIGKAVPFSIIPLLTVFSMFSSPSIAAFSGFLSGAFLDGTQTGIPCFHTVILMLLAVFISVLSENFFNRNIRSAALLSFFAALIFFLAKWIALYAFRVELQSSLFYFLYYVIPSVIYTQVFLFIFYPIFRRMDRLKGV